MGFLRLDVRLARGTELSLLNVSHLLGGCGNRVLALGGAPEGRFGTEHDGGKTSFQHTKLNSL